MENQYDEEDKNWYSSRFNETSARNNDNIPKLNSDIFQKSK